MSGCGARTAAGSLEAVFEFSDVERFGWILMEVLGGEAEETALFLPVMRQVFAQPQQPARRQRVGLTAREERAHDFRAEIGQPNKRSEPALIHSEASAHCLDAVVRS